MKHNLFLKNPNGEEGATSNVRNIFGLLLVASLALNVHFIFFSEPEELPVALVAVTPEPAVAEATKTEAVSADAVDKTAPSKTQKDSFQVQNISLISQEHFDGRNVRSLHFTINRSLNRTLCNVLSRAEGCQILSAYIGRLLVWFIDINKQMRNGDSINLIYEEVDSEERFKILKLKYKSQFLNKTLEANYYKYPGPHHGSFFDTDGKEIALRIADDETPIRNYIEITSLPGDYRKGRFRGHSGTDFKAPVGTPIYTGFDGKVTRKNWNVRSNGYSLEINHPGAKVKTRYLHLSKTLVEPGEFVKKGKKIAESGNSGRSFAPHLHYEVISLGSKPVVKSPFKSKVHKTYYRRVPPQRKEEFMKTVDLYDSALPAKKLNR